MLDAQRRENFNCGCDFCLINNHGKLDTVFCRLASMGETMADKIELKIRNINITWDGSSLMFQDGDNSNSNITFPASNLPELIDFLCSVKPEEKEKELRMGFRVPLSVSRGITASIIFGGKTCSVRPLNLSLSGILVEFSEGEVYEMPIDTHIKIRIQLQQITTVLNGVVSRRSGNQYGIFFPDSVRGKELDPPDSLQAICTTLEKQWLRERVKSELV